MWFCGCLDIYTCQMWPIITRKLRGSLKIPFLDIELSIQYYLPGVVLSYNQSGQESGEF